jgi:hypothetical protein
VQLLGYFLVRVAINGVEVEHRPAGRRQLPYQVQQLVERQRIERRSPAIGLGGAHLVEVGVQRMAVLGPKVVDGRA